MRFQEKTLGVEATGLITDAVVVLVGAGLLVDDLILASSLQAIVNPLTPSSFKGALE